MEVHQKRRPFLATHIGANVRLKSVIFFVLHQNHQWQPLQ